DRNNARRDPTLPHVLGGDPLGAPGTARMKIERILVGTDRSETATRAVKFALDMARRYEAELIVLQAGGETEELDRYVAEHAPGRAGPPLRKARPDPLGAARPDPARGRRGARGPPGPRPAADRGGGRPGDGGGARRSLGGRLRAHRARAARGRDDRPGAPGT